MNAKQHVPMVVFGLCAGLSPLLLGGCTAPGPSPMSYGVRQWSSVDGAALFQAAERTLIESGFRIERRDPTVGVLTTYPIEARAFDEERPRATLGTPGRLRRVAEVRIKTGAEGSSVYCRVAVQQQATEAYRIHAGDLQTSDTPAYTPIEREGATTKAQNTVWRTVRRDKVLERDVLSAIERAIEGKYQTATRPIA